MEKAKIIRVSKTQVVVLCPYCGKEHFHGLESVGSHVVSHCINAQPNDGYERAQFFNEQIDEDCAPKWKTACSEEWDVTDELTYWMNLPQPPTGCLP